MKPFFLQRYSEFGKQIYLYNRDTNYLVLGTRGCTYFIDGLSYSTIFRWREILK